MSGVVKPGRRKSVDLHPDAQGLEPGDILVVSMGEGGGGIADRLFGKVTQLAQGGLTHTVMYVGNGQVVEANQGRGVTKEPLHESLGTKSFVAVRPKLPAKVRRHAARFATTQVGKGYDNIALVRTGAGLVLPEFISKHLDKKQIPTSAKAWTCSNLVGASYAKAKLTPFGGIPAPVDFRNSDHVDHVKTVVRKPEHFRIPLFGRQAGVPKIASRGEILAGILHHAGRPEAALRVREMGHAAADKITGALLHEPKWQPSVLKGRHILPKKLVHGLARMAGDNPEAILVDAIPGPLTIPYLIANKRLGERLTRNMPPLLQKSAAVKTELQPHQQRVVDKITREDQPGLVVAHGLGSGKTLASIAAQDALGMPAAVVLPAALRANYAKEQHKHLSGKSPPTNLISIEQAARTGVPGDEPMLIVDEAHRARTPGAKTLKALKANEAQKRLLLTASPFYNHPVDVAPLVNVAAGDTVLPEMKTEFARQYVRDDVIHPKLLDRLKGVRPGVIPRLNPRKKKELGDILGKWVDYHPSSSQDFPEVIREDVEVPMTSHQLQVYDTILRSAPAWVAAKIRSGLPPSKQEAKELNAFMSGVRQVSNTTGAFQESEHPDQPKIDRAVEELQKTLAENERAKAVVYSNWLSSGVQPYSRKLQEAGIPFGEFTGEMPRKQRDELVRQYNEGKIRALLLSSAGGEGLDLKGTRLLQLLDPHWNAEKLRQVEGRGIRYKSHADLPEEERNVRVQRFLSTRPPKGIFEKLHLKKTGLSADQYLTQLSHDKERLNDEFRALLEERSQSPADPNAPRSPLHKEGSVKEAMSPFSVIGGALAAAGLGLVSYDVFKGRGLEKDRHALGSLIDGSHEDAVDAVSYMQERDPSVVVVDTPAKVDALAHAEFGDHLTFKQHMAVEIQKAALAAKDNAIAFVGKSGRAYIITQRRVHPIVLEHEYGHVQDFRAKGIVSLEPSAYSPGMGNALRQVVDQGAFRRGTLERERAAWRHVKDDLPGKQEAEAAALGSYEKGFHQTRVGVVAPLLLSALAAAAIAKTAEAPDPLLGLSKEKRQARNRVDSLFKSDDPSKWDDFLRNARRKSFVSAVQSDLRSDPKLDRHVDQMNRLLTGSTVGHVKGKTGSYRIVRLRGTDEVGCTCNDWRFRKSVSPEGQQDCKHIRQWRSENMAKTAGVLSSVRDALTGASLAEAKAARKAAEESLDRARTAMSSHMHAHQYRGTSTWQSHHRTPRLKKAIEDAEAEVGRAGANVLKERVKTHGGRAAVVAVPTAAAIAAVRRKRQDKTAAALSPEQKHQQSAAVHEILGLGLLAAPSVIALAAHAPGRMGAPFKPAANFLAKSPTLGHAVEVAGLGILARPSMQELGRLHAVKKAEHDLIHGGKADKRPPSAFDPRKVEQGARVEREHTDSKALAREISRDHLTEDPEYYRKLKKVEASAPSEYISTEDRTAWRARSGSAKCSLNKDEKGFFCHTHRARSKSYPSVSAIPDSVIRWIGSTG